jgi:peptide/nickel transport system substrate-binding protein
VNRGVIAVTFAAVTFAAVAFTSAGVAAGPHELRFAVAGDPKTFDALHAEDIVTETIRYITSGVLVRLNRLSDQLQPELAESWEIREGGRAITFHLRAGLKFSDGSALTANAVARTLSRALDPKEGSTTGDTFRSGEVSPEIRVASPREITLRYKAPKAGLDRLFDGLAILPPKLAKLPASAGPFFVSEYRSGQYLRLARNPWYWKRDSSGKQLPYLDSIRIDIQQNRDIELARFLRGELHMVDRLNPESFDRVLKQSPAAARSLGASLDPEFLWFNQAPTKHLPAWKRRWFTSAVFRHAVSNAIHRDDIARIVYRGHAHVAAGPISPANRFWFNTALQPLASNPPEAILKSLASDGFSLRGGTLQDREGHPVEFSLITNAGNRSRERMASLIQADLRRIGIRVNIVTLDFGSLIERITKTLDYEAGLMGFSNIEFEPMEQMNVWLSSGMEHAWWPAQKSPATPWEARIDELLLKQASQISRDARKKENDEVQRIAVAQEPIIYLVNPDYLCAISPSVRGAQPAVSPPQLWWNVEWLRLD